LSNIFGSNEDKRPGLSNLRTRLSKIEQNGNHPLVLTVTVWIARFFTGFTRWHAEQEDMKAVSKIQILDSAFNTLLAISKIVGNQPDSTVTVNAAPVGVNGFSNNVNTTVFSAELDSAQINLLKQMGKVIYEYKLYTDPNLIPPPHTTVKISGSNLLKFTGFGKLKYRINF